MDADLGVTWCVWPPKSPAGFRQQADGGAADVEVAFGWFGFVSAHWGDVVQCVVGGTGVLLEAVRGGVIAEAHYFGTARDCGLGEWVLDKARGLGTTLAVPGRQVVQDGQRVPLCEPCV